MLQFVCGVGIKPKYNISWQGGGNYDVWQWHGEGVQHDLNIVAKDGRYQTTYTIVPKFHKLGLTTIVNEMIYSFIMLYILGVGKGGSKLRRMK